MEHDGPLTEAELLSLLHTTFLGGVTCFEETDSTNTQAVKLLTSGVDFELPHLVYAEVQTSGRGRSANRWWSTEGSLTFSVIIDWAQHGLSSGQRSLLPLLTGLSILASAKQFVPDGDLSLKWPNDIYLAGRKLAGILTEAPSQSPAHVVIGIGINVNNACNRAPDGLREIAFSLSEQAGRTVNRVDVLHSMMNELELVLGSIAAGDDVFDRWPEYCLLTGKRVTLQTGSTAITGHCLGIDESGALLLETSAGVKRFVGGVVKSWT